VETDRVGEGLFSNNWYDEWILNNTENKYRTSNPEYLTPKWCEMSGIPNEI
jgi:hypothetical protein